MRDLPSGTVTFLFTDIEGSTRLLHELGAEEYAEALSEHRRIMRDACAAHDGAEVDTQGDAFFFAFPTAPGALEAAQAVTEGLKATPIQVRIGIHTGTPLLTEEGYVGADVHLAARIAAAGHGGQTLVSASAAPLVTPRDSESPRVTFVDLGEHRLADLSAPQHIFQLGDGEFPPLKSLYQTNLPIPPTPFLGRERELREVVNLLERKDVRLLTLTGAGGTGKTRLAMQAAAEVANEYEHGVWWVPLAALRDATIVLEQVAHTLGARSTLASHIAAKRLLLVLDNFEQVLEARLDVAELITPCPNLDVLVTSREPLHITGEQEYAVPTLEESEAIDLFHARATAALAHFAGDGVVADICRRLDNLPLAIELAAARIKSLTTDAILSRLQQRLALLTGGVRDAPERQRTLRATIAWSQDLLSPEERLLFARLSMFAGGFTLEAAEDVATADFDTLDSLVDKSLVRHDGGRYSMLETIREYALEQLEESGQADNVRDRHADYFAALAQSGAPADSIGALRVELDNFRAALAWFRSSGSTELELRLATSLFDLWIVGGYSGEGHRAVEGALASSPAHPSDLRAKALKAAGDLALDHGDLPAAKEFLEQALSLYRDLGVQQNVARCLTDLGHVAKAMRDHDRAEALFGESITLARDLDDASVLAEALLNYGDFLVSKADYVRAEAMCRESLALYEELGFSLSVATCRFSLALACLHQDRQQEAFDLLRDCLGTCRDFDYAVGIASSFEGLAAIAALRGDGKKAARLLGAAEVLFGRVGAPLQPGEQALHERTVADLRDQLGDAALERFWTDGRVMSVEVAIEYALDPATDPLVAERLDSQASQLR